MWKDLLFFLALAFGLLNADLSKGQSQLAAWDQYEVDIKSNNKKLLFDIEFYRGPNVDSIRIINLNDTSRNAYGRMFPLSSSGINAEDVRKQISAELQISSNKQLNDSLIWNNVNKVKVASALRRLALTPLKSATVKPPPAPDPTKTVDSLVSILGKSIDTLTKSIPAISKKVDSISQKVDSLQNTLGKGSGNLNAVTGNLAPKAASPSKAIEPGPVSTTPEKKESTPSSGKNTVDSKKDSLRCDSCSLIYLLTAANFNFSGKLSTTYMGRLNIFAPNLHHSRFGFNTGIEKINYSNGNINGNDSSSSIYYQQNYVLNPLQVYRGPLYDTVLAGAKYIQEYNQYTYSNTNTVWSFYFQPMYKFLPMGNWDRRQGLYVHVHFELLVNQWTRTASIKNIYTNPDTSIAVTPSDSSFYWVKNNPIVSNFNFLTGNFGAGITFYTNLRVTVKDTSTHFWGQVTAGASFHAPDLGQLSNPNEPPSPNGTYPHINFTYPKAQPFYLIRINFIRSLSTTSQLMIGGVFRGGSSPQNYQYAVYLGLSLDVAALSKLIGTGE
jgi:hypothetical protein